MKIVHIFMKEKFTQGVVRFYDSFFPNVHTICYMNYLGEPSLIDKNISISQREFYFQSKNTPFFHLIKFFRMLNKYDYIVFHSFFMLSPKAVLLLSLWSGLIKKLVWIEWGGDLYQWEESCNSRTWILLQIKKWANYRIRVNCNAVVCIFPPDCEMYHKMFPKSKAKVFYAPYCGLPMKKPDEEGKAFIKIPEKINKREGEILIQVGHSGDSTLNHMETLSMLNKYRDENMQILLPLSYSWDSKEYVNKIIDYANNHFPGKIIILTEMLPKDQYFELLKRVNVAIFNTERQIGLGNINSLLQNNVKVYLREDGVMYQYFLDNGQPVEKISNIEKESFEQFISAPKVDEKKRDDYWKKQSSMERKVELWKNVYEYLENK